jgi:hypothetical protein
MIPWKHSHPELFRQIREAGNGFGARRERQAIMDGGAVNDILFPLPNWASRSGSLARTLTLNHRHTAAGDMAMPRTDIDGAEGRPASPARPGTLKQMERSPHAPSRVCGWAEQRNSEAGSMSRAFTGSLFPPPRLGPGDRRIIRRVSGAQRRTGRDVCAWASRIQISRERRTIQVRLAGSRSHHGARAHPITRPARRADGPRSMNQASATVDAFNNGTLNFLSSSQIWTSGAVLPEALPLTSRKNESAACRSAASRTDICSVRDGRIDPGAAAMARGISNQAPALRAWSACSHIALPAGRR